MKKTLKCLLALMLCAAMLLPLIPAAMAVTTETVGLPKSTLPPYVKEAPAVKENPEIFKPNAATAAAKVRSARAIGGGEDNGYYTTYTFESFEDLKELASRTYDSQTRFEYAGTESVLTISENLTLPEKTSFWISAKILVPSGVTFTVSWSERSSVCYGLEVNGVCNINGMLELYEELTVNGRVNLCEKLFLYPSVAVITGFENIVVEDWGSIRYWHYISTESEMHEAIAQTNADPHGLAHDIFFQPWEVDEIVFSKSFDIPANGRLSLQNGVTYTVPSDITMTVNGIMDMHAWKDPKPVLKIAGKLVNNNEISISFENTASQMLVFTDTGAYSGYGTLQISSYGSEFDWTTVVSGLDTTNMEITGNGTWYNLQDISNKIKLSAPENPTWHKLAEWNGENYQLVDRKGAIAWEDGEVKDPSSEYQYYFVQIYKDGEYFYWFRWGFTDYFEENGLPLSIDASMRMNEAEWESGTYYFTVQAIPDPNSTNSEYLASDIVTSDTWQYTKPGDFATPSGLSWNWPTMNWSGTTGQDYHHIEIQYSPTENGEYKSAYSILFNTGIGYTLDMYDLEELTTQFGAGYYRFKVRTMSTDITKNYHSKWSSWSDSCYFDGSLELAAPTIKATNVASSGKPKLTWEKVEGAAKYEVYRATSKTGTYTRLTTTTGTSLTNTSAEAGKTYYYKVRAVDANGNKSDWSNIVNRTCDLAQPTISSLTIISSTGKIKVKWGAVTGATKYELYCSTDNQTWKKLTTTTGTTINHNSGVAGTKYYYKVRAIASTSAANSAYSAVKSGTCDLARPTISSLTIITSTGKIKIKWGAVTGATKYELYCSTDNQTWKKLTTTTGTSINHNSAVAGTKYYYKVRAISSNSAANSAYSTVKSGTCDLARPTLTVKLNTGGKPVLTWTKIEGAVKYEIYRSTDNKTWTKLSTTTGTKLTNTSAVSGKTYYYKVRAIASNSAANSAYSVIKSISAK